MVISIGGLAEQARGPDSHQVNREDLNQIHEEKHK